MTTPRGRDTEEGSKEASFRSHLATYLAMGLFFFVLNVLTSFGDWWFYWPLFGWGIGIVAHALAVFGANAPAEVVGLIHGWVARITPGSPAHPRSRGAAAGERPAPPPASTTPAVTADAAEARVARLWRLARRIPSEAARERAFRVCVAADRVAEALGQDNADPQLVGWFVERHLAPTEALLERYARVARRGVAGAESALTRVEEHDLPLLESRLDTLYQQLHRGDVIDLAVASEMLELEDAGDRPPAPSRRTLA